tara:strand:- start:11772 stop:11978 length:207 start_codon:yes stop_codon:yes gene_type:complete
MDYENGFYIYTPSKEGAEGMHELSMPQVIQIIEGEIWLTGVYQDFDIDYVEALGVIGKMVMDEEGELK